jgi:hypothetical protein
MFPVLFISGIWFSRDDMPHWLRTVGDALPVAHLSDALHQAVQASSFGAAFAPGDLAVLVAWAPGPPGSRAGASRGCRPPRRPLRRTRLKTGPCVGVGRGPSQAPHESEGNPGWISEGSGGDLAKRPRPASGVRDS